MNLAQKLIHIAGSVSPTCEPSLAQEAHDLVYKMATALLERGARLLVLANADPRGEQGTRLTFDWTIIEAAMEFAAANGDTPGAITALTSTKTRVPEEYQHAWDALLRRGIAHQQVVQEERYVGGVQRAEQADLADVLITLGGGKGTLDLAELHMRRGNVVIPIRAPIGSSCNDGAASLNLHARCLASPSEFLPEASKGDASLLALLDLSRPPQDVAGDVLELLDRTRGRRQAHVELRDHTRCQPIDSGTEEYLYLCDVSDYGDQTRKRILNAVETYGLCQVRVDGLDAGQEVLTSLAETIGPASIRQNFSHGPVKHIRPKSTGKLGSGDTSTQIGLHVDGTQHDETPALLGFQYVVKPKAGGESVFVDGASVFRDIQETDLERVISALSRDDAARFTKHAGPEDDPSSVGCESPLVYQGPIISLSPDGTLRLRLRFDDVIDVHPDCRPAFEFLRERFGDPVYRVSFTPRDGDVVIFDNWRLLHARCSVMGARQREHYRIWINHLHARHGGIRLGLRFEGLTQLLLSHTHRPILIRTRR